MLERKRLRKTGGGGGAYTEVPGAEDGDVEEDIELGEGIIGAQESGVSSSSGGAAAAPPEGRKLTLEEEVDTWDENAPDDWDAPPAEGSNVEEVKKQRAD